MTKKNSKTAKPDDNPEVIDGVKIIVLVVDGYITLVLTFEINPNAEGLCYHIRKNTKTHTVSENLSRKTLAPWNDFIAPLKDFDKNTISEKIDEQKNLAFYFDKYLSIEEGGAEKLRVAVKRKVEKLFNSSTGNKPSG